MRLFTLLLLALLSQPVLAAHPDHDPVTMTGTLAQVLADRVEVEVFDAKLLRTRLIVASIDEKTKCRLGKQKIEPSQLEPGARIVITMEPLDAENRVTDFRAIEIRASEPKKKK
jgi:hypothetical protein